MFHKVLIANRGAIACRIIRTLRRMGIAPVAVYSEADRHSLHVEQAAEAVLLGPAPAAQSYLSIPALIEAARRTGVQAIHPGYGFLSENAAFAEGCAAHGIVFVGPTPAQMRDFGLKHTARRIAEENGLPLLPGTGLLATVDEALAAAARIGYPVMLKSTAGGGGIGMRVCPDAASLAEAYTAVGRLSQASFGAAGIYLEKFVARARHIEVQIFGDGCGAVLALGERDCSAQRRHQKVIEETPAPGLATETRTRLLDSAIHLGKAVRYQSAGTVEFLYDPSTVAFYFLEVNTRLQVEHGVTEEVTGVDLVEWMVLQAAGAMPDLSSLDVTPRGCSIQARLYAEDPGKDFQPSSGRLQHVRWPIRAAHQVSAAAAVVPETPHAPAADEPRGPTPLREATPADGLPATHEVPAAAAVVSEIPQAPSADGPHGRTSPQEAAHEVPAAEIPRQRRKSGATDLLSPLEARAEGASETRARIETWVETGTEVTPYYDPMLAKIIVHAGSREAALERLCTALAECRVDGIETNLEYLRQVCASPAFQAGGISTAFLRDFHYRRHAIDVVDAGTQTTIQDYPGRIGYWHVGVPPSGPMDSLAFRLANRLVGNPESAAGLEITVTGPTLQFRSDTVIALTGADFDARLDGAPLPRWQSVLAKAGALLEMGAAQGAGTRGYLAVAGGFDAPAYLGSASTFILGRFGGCFGRVLRPGDVLPIQPAGAAPLRQLPAALTPSYSHSWDIGVLYGPHGAPDFFTPADIETFFSTAWKVHHNSDRTGVRLIGPKPEWARPDGGEAGLHPSNIHDNAYAVGTIDFTGDMPVILGPDGPSLGGFVCPATIIDAELWKVGQLKPGDLVRFHAVSLEQARAMQAALDSGSLPHLPFRPEREEPILRSGPAIVIRADGDQYLLLEYGPNVLDLNLRFRVHALENQLRAMALDGILDITPGVRSLHIHYDGRKLTRAALMEALDHCESLIPALDDIVAPSRVVHLPLSWDDPATRLAIQKYTQSVRPDAPWCPSNIEFIRRINGLPSVDDVQRTVFSANYLVLGLGDVYLGAPVATPTDPRHRLVTTKYNPARTWTPENAVGIGGAYLCVYGMEGPGGYQFVGRTVQMWNTFRSTREFQPGTPWLLRFFDQVRFYPVSAAELLEIRDAFPHGRYPLRIETQEFRLADYHAFLASIQQEAAEFKRRQHEAFLEERERWAAAGADRLREPPELAAAPAVNGVPEGCRPVCSPVAANVWSIGVAAGQRVEAGQRLVVLEAMKMEIAVAAPFSGTIETLHCAPGNLVAAGQHLITVRQEAIV